MFEISPTPLFSARHVQVTSHSILYFIPTLQSEVRYQSLAPKEKLRLRGVNQLAKAHTATESQFLFSHSQTCPPPIIHSFVYWPLSCQALYCNTANIPQALWGNERVV